METLILNAGGKTQKVRQLTEGGKKYLIAPAVIITNGVHAGSDGPVYYDDADNAEAAPRWKGVLITNGHPKDSGGKLSSLKDAPGWPTLGVVEDPKHKDGKTRVTARFEDELLRKYAPKVRLRLLKGEKVELSTGLFSDKVLVGNEDQYHNGVPYKHKAVKHRPDHLAVLEDKAGACSVAKGCGFLANECQCGGTCDGCKDEVTANELSMMERHALACAALRDKHQKPGYYWDGYVVEVYDSYLVYRVDGKLYRQDYSGTDSGVELTGEPVEVVRKTEYVTANGSLVGNAGNDKPVSEDDMADKFDKKAHVQTLIANGDFAETDRPTLEGMNDDFLQKITPKAKTPPVETAKKVTANEEKEGPKDGGPGPLDGKKKMTFNELLNIVDGPTANMLKATLARSEQYRKNLISKITANKASNFTEDELSGFDDPMLEKLAAVAAPKVSDANGDGVSVDLPYNFAGQSAAVTANEGADGPDVKTMPKRPKADFAARNRDWSKGRE